MHFFTEPERLTTQAAADAFGPVVGDEANKYRISSKHTIESTSSTDPAKIFACQDAMMLVLPTIDQTTKNPVTDKVNLILKPIDSLLIPHQPIKYYIYRGIRRSDFFNGTAIIDDDTANTEFINKFHFNWENGLTPDEDPDPKVMGFHDDLATNTTYRAYLIEEFFNSSASLTAYIQDFAAIRVNEGQWIGNVPSGDSFELEIITDTENMPISVEYTEYDSFQINASSNPIDYDNITLESLTAREKVLNYLDPSAFFGMHFEVGIRIHAGYTPGTDKSNTTAPQLKQKDLLVDEILDVFKNKEVVYLDIRSERGYSYNFYQNYKDDDSKILILKSKTDLFYHKLDYTDMDWPLVNLNNPPNNLGAINDGAPIYLRLSIKDNKTPVLFAEDPKLFGADNKSQFLTTTDLVDLEDSDEYTKIIKLFVPFVKPGLFKKNVSCCIKLQYFREANDVSSPPAVFKVEDYLDSIFGGLNNPSLKIPTKFNHVQNTKRQFVKGNNFSFVADTGIYFERSVDPLVVMYSEVAYSQQSSGSSYPKMEFNSETSAGVLKRKNILYNKSRIVENSVDVDLIEVVIYNEVTNTATPKENLHLLGLTKEEYDAILTELSGFDDQMYLKFEKQTNMGAELTDDNGVSFNKFKLKVTGLNSDLTRHEEDSFGSIGNIFVYGTNRTMLCSKAFADEIILTQNLPDPATKIQYPYVGTQEYTAEHPDATHLFANGRVEVNDDTSNNLKNFKPEIDLTGELFYPVATPYSNVLDTSGAPYPLIVISHGNGQRYREYRKLAKFLAQNGFIVASINNLMAPSDNEYYIISDFSQINVTSSVTSTAYPNQPSQLLIVGDRLYVYDTSTNKISVLSGGYTNEAGTAFSYTEEYPLNWRFNTDFGFVRGKLKWEYDAADAATHGEKSGVIIWNSNSGTSGNRQADFTKLTGAKLVQLTQSDYNLADYDSAAIMNAIDTATGINTLHIPYPKTVAEMNLSPIYFGTKLSNGAYLRLKVVSSSVSGSGSTEEVTINLEYSRASLMIFKKVLVGSDGVGILGRANMIYPHLQFIKRRMGTDVQNNIGLIGHSRGAESVVRSATEMMKDTTTIRRYTDDRVDITNSHANKRYIPEYKNVPQDLDQINAVISLAPTDQIGKSDTSNTAITFDPVKIAHDIPFYLLYGSMEGDVTGIHEAIRPERTSAFSIYDRSVSEDEKAMSFVYGATHNGFITDNHDYQKFITKKDKQGNLLFNTNYLGNLLDISKQQDIAKGYFNAFMRMYLKGENYWNPYFQGDVIPPSSQTNEIYPQYRNMETSSVKWFENFSVQTPLPDIKLYTSNANPINVSFVNPPISYPLGAIVAGRIFNLRESPAGSGNATPKVYSPHADTGVYIKFASGKNSLRFNLGGKDATSYNYFSFRIGHVVNTSTGHTYEDLDKLNIRLVDASDHTSARETGKKVPAPFMREEDYVKSAMMTIRLPLNSFVGDADLGNIAFLYLDFPGTGTVIMTDFEFTD